MQGLAAPAVRLGQKRDLLCRMLEYEYVFLPRSWTPAALRTVEDRGYMRYFRIDVLDPGRSTRKA